MKRPNAVMPTPMSALNETGVETLPSGERPSVLVVPGAASGSIARLFAGFGPRIALAPEGGEGGGADTAAGGAGSDTVAGGAGTDTVAGGEGGEGSKLTKPEGIPDQFWDAEKGIKHSELAAHLNDLTAFKAAADSKTAAVPEKADGYELKLPEGLEFPEGFGFELNADDPMLAWGRDVAHAMGLDQTGFEKLVGMYAQREVTQVQELEAAKARQLEALGPKGQERQNAVKTFLSAKLGPDALEVFAPVLMLKSGVETLEKLMRVASSGGTPGVTNSGRVSGGNSVSEEEYQAMSPAERLVHARQARAGGR